MTAHDYITVRGRRWCLNCNTYQIMVIRDGKWIDAYPASPWPGYEKTQERCGQASLFEEVVDERERSAQHQRREEGGELRAPPDHASETEMP